ncbi:hypothetical protein [Symmachiella dynata]|uniref:hypothetical protein n=1 Tax=Symmachiella dynata TaxID=2527995 RepID=UPI0030ED7E54
MKLPDCHSRHAVSDLQHEYHCTHPDVYARGRRVTDGVCKVCELWRLPPPGILVEHAAYSPLVRIGRCRHLGDQTGERLCPTCGGSVRVKLFACGHPNHSETTMRDCLLCNDYENPPE